MKKRGAKYPNITASLYEGEQMIVFECPIKWCRWRRCFTEPADDNEDCAFLREGGECGNAGARQAALEALEGALAALREEVEA